MTTVVIARFLHPPHERGNAKIDYLGIATLTVSLVSLLLATSFGGTTYPWGSVVILGLYPVGIVALVHDDLPVVEEVGHELLDSMSQSAPNDGAERRTESDSTDARVKTSV